MDAPLRFADIVAGQSEGTGQRVAWLERDRDGLLVRQYTWTEVSVRCSAAAEYLLNAGVQPQDRVSNVCANCLDWAVLDLACSAINAIHVPLDPRLRKEQLLKCIDRVNARLVFYSDLNLGGDDRWIPISDLCCNACHVELKQLCMPYLPRDIANILFTSGTLDEPRGVMLTHQNLVSNALAKLDAMPQSETDHRLNLLPFAHAYARTCELSTWILSGSSMEVARGVSEFLRIAPLSMPTLINAVPVVFEQVLSLCESDYQKSHSVSRESSESIRSILGPHLRRLASGGAGIQESTRHWFSKAGYPIFQGYGLTEASPVLCSNREATETMPARMHHVGPPVTGVRIRIDSESRLWAKGPGIMTGYWNNPEATDERMKDGWLDTGDIAEFVSTEKDTEYSSGESVRILGRVDDALVLTSGYKIHPIPIEMTLNAQAWCSRCLMIGNHRPFPILLFSMAEKQDLVEDDWQMRILEKIRSALAAFPLFAVPRSLLRVHEDWQTDNDLCNFKGALLRRRIEQRYQTRIDELYLKLK